MKTNITGNNNLEYYTQFGNLILGSNSEGFCISKVIIICHFLKVILWYRFKDLEKDCKYR